MVLVDYHFVSWFVPHHLVLLVLFLILCYSVQQTKYVGHHLAYTNDKLQKLCKRYTHPHHSPPSSSTFIQQTGQYWPETHRTPPLTAQTQFNTIIQMIAYASEFHRVATSTVFVPSFMNGVVQELSVEIDGNPHSLALFYY